MLQLQLYSTLLEREFFLLLSFVVSAKQDLLEFDIGIGLLYVFPVYFLKELKVLVNVNVLHFLTDIDLRGAFVLILSQNLVYHGLLLGFNLWHCIGSLGKYELLGHRLVVLLLIA